MEPTYKVRGLDGKEYGPVTLDQAGTWLEQGRINAQTEVMRSDVDHWSPAVDYPEFQSSLQPEARVISSSQGTSPEPARAAPAMMPGANLALEAQLKSGASWFYWIAGLSLVNAILAFTGSGWGFIVGLGIAQIFSAIGHELGGGGRVVVLILNALVSGVFIFFGVFAHKRHTWAFIVGMVLYLLDGLLYLLVMDWLSLGFHVFVLYCLFRGFQACRELNAG